MVNELLNIILLKFIEPLLPWEYYAYATDKTVNGKSRGSTSPQKLKKKNRKNFDLSTTILGLKIINFPFY